MQGLLAWVPLLPLIGFLILVGIPLFYRREPPESVIALIGVGSVGIAAICTAVATAAVFWQTPSAVVNIALWQWMQLGDLQLGINFHVDWLALVMMMIVTGVGFLIHLYSAGYMRKDPDFRRYFAYLNLFIFAMLILVMADNLVLLYLGWEGVGLCSYLLIGFWYKDPVNGTAACKAFIVTRIGDTAMAIGLFLLFYEFSTLNIPQLITAADDPGANREMITIATLLLLGGAVGKSAQLPLQTWLPDAMAGPTPVSALIHAATMVTAGVYLIARMHPLYILSETAMTAVATVGALTLLLAGFSAIAQSDIKRVLAYSTISQIGYMFLALGVGAWSGAIFHLMTHAFFKALLFLSAGSVILSLHHEQNIFSMGGLYRKIPFTCLCFTIGCACLAALPLTSGFYSKDQILLRAWEFHEGFNSLWFAGVLGALITGIYTFRVLFLVFAGTEGTASIQCKDANTPVMTIPLAILATLALLGGLLTPPLQAVFGTIVEKHPAAWVEGVAIAMPLIGLVVAWQLFRREKKTGEQRSRVTQFWFSGWGFDWLYDHLLVRPFNTLSRLNHNDIIDALYKGTAAFSRQLNMLLSASQNGQVRWYLATFAAGSILFLALLVAL
ncbi:NADH-quinone oxidoreductase subunit L [Microbulbifer sp. 2205BS26-8]|uniref:NADH-quinone oxidoreductase subunit L n=1 Tax=Microbulbifer sp. 2205BS26-8 TaxID=3064386 RepID=UPI00273CFFB0|nr:NADH-quinone oxidoreductase subunit L [Microbulbifer sp. 2205BS26-8]MDP5209168.1 NADH-quinone oxidoreductase subunit L [Microbulbifer sp. 2205BS26-8]